MEKANRKRLIEEAFNQVEYHENIIDSFVDAFSDGNTVGYGLSMREFINKNRYLGGDNYKSIEDKKVSQILYFEAEEYLGKALSNLCIGCLSMNRGYLSWGEVTLYYSSFFAIHGLLRLQGKALGTNYVLVPQSIRHPASMLEHKYEILKPVGAKGIHDDILCKFFNTYSKNSQIDQTLYKDAIFFSDIQDVRLEVERRNKYNYRTFEAYQEIFDIDELNRRSLFNLHEIDELFFSRLTEYLGDADRRYIAKAALRIQLLHELLFMISENMEFLGNFYIERHKKRIEFLDNTLIASDPIDRKCVEEGCLVIP